jgi:hypothetical protein
VREQSRSAATGINFTYIIRRRRERHTSERKRERHEIFHIHTFCVVFAQFALRLTIKTQKRARERENHTNT